MPGVRGDFKHISEGGIDRGLHQGRVIRVMLDSVGTAGDGHKLASGFPALKEGEWSLSGDFVEVKL